MSDLDGPELANLVAEGGRLSVVLEPFPNSEDLGKPLDHYIECYSLPHVCAQGTSVWGATRKSHVVHKESKGLESIISFFYTNAFPLYGFLQCRDELRGLQNGAATVRLLSQTQYQTVRFITREPGLLVWRDKEPDDVDSLIKSIQSGCSHYATFKDRFNVVRSHPLDLVFVFPETNSVRILVEHAILPEVFFNPEEFLGKLSRSVSNFEKSIQSPKFHGQADMTAFSGFRRIDGSGVCFDPIALVNGEAQSVSDIRIFAYP